MTEDGRGARERLFLFASLYASQGVVVAYFFNFNKNHMVASGLNEGFVGGLETIVLLPFVFKFLFGPLSDRFALFGWGHRKPYIVIGLVLQSVGLIGLSQVDPGSHWAAFGGWAFAVVIGLACYDTCCDGLAVDVTPPEDRSRTQGIMLTSRFAATTLSTFLIGARLQGAKPGLSRSRIPEVLLACAALGLAPLIQTLRFSEPRRAARSESFRWSALKTLLQPSALALAAFGTIYAMAGIGAEINLAGYYREVGLEGEIGSLGAIRYAGRAAGALILPWGYRLFRRRGCLTIGILGLAGATASQSLLHSRLEALPLAFLFGVANGWNDALFGVMAMDAADPALAASTFALLMAVTNLSVAGDWLFAKAVFRLGGDYRLVYQIAAGVVLCTVPLTIPLGRSVRRDGTEPPHGS